MNPSSYRRSRHVSCASRQNPQIPLSGPQSGSILGLAFLCVMIAASVTWIAGCAPEGDDAARSGDAASRDGADTASESPAKESARDAQVEAHRNLAKAHFENGEVPEALAQIEQALALSEGAYIDRLNEAKILFLAQRHEEAIPKFQALQEERPDLPDPPYNLGIIYKRMGQAPEAVPYLERVTQLEPRAAEAWFNLAVLYQRVDRREDALRCIDTVLELDPYHAAAYYQRASLLRAARRMDEAKAAIERFSVLKDRLASEDLSSESLEESPYFEMGLRSPGETAPAPAASGAGGPGAPTIRFVETTAQILAPAAAQPPEGWSATSDAVDVDVADLDADGHLDFVVLYRAHPRVVVFWNDGSGAFSAQSVAPPVREGASEGGSPRDLVLFDLDNDADIDVFVLGAFDAKGGGAPEFADGNLYLISDGRRGFRAHAARSPEDLAATTPLPVRHHAFPVDYDHDGDLDLILSDPKLTVLRNTGSPDSTVLPHFIEATAAAQLEAVNGRIAYAGDVDRDADLDLLGLDTSPGALGQLLGLANVGRQEFVVRAEVDGAVVAQRAALSGAHGLQGVVFCAGDFDNDSWTDGLVATADGATLLRNEGGFRFRPTALDAGSGIVALHAFDADNDGDLDVACARRDEGADLAPGLLLNLGEGAFADRSVEVQLVPQRSNQPSPPHDDPAAVSWSLDSGDLDGDGDLDLVYATSAGLHVFRNDGGNAHGRLLVVELDGGKSNHFGYGATVEVADAGFFVHRTVESSPLSVGVGPLAQVDFVRFAWPSGIVQNEIAVAVGEPRAILRVEEKKEALGSCPSLFAWTGKMEFVTDVLATTSIGLVLDGINAMPFDDEELIRLPEITRRDGQYRFTLADELDEIIYFDHAELWAVDHPAEWTLYSNAVLREPPFPDADVVVVENERAPRGAWTGRGLDVGAALARSDGAYAAEFDAYGGGYHGLCRPHTVTIDLGEEVDRARLVLVVDAWMDWPETATFIAIAQNPGLELILPRIRARATREPGSILTGRIVHPGFGIQALKPKPVVIDLAGLLEPGERYLEIETNLQTYWNRISIAERVDPAAEGAERIVRHTAKPATADIYYRGHSTLEHPDDSPLGLYSYDRVDLAAPWVGSTGAFTRYGEVTELLHEWDDRYAILNTGDAVDFAFDATEFPAPGSARQRTWFVRLGGFDKQGDYGTLASGAVEPLPFRGMSGYPYPADESYPSSAAHRDYRERYNTRHVAERPRTPASATLDRP